MATVNDITNAAYLKCGLRSPTDAGDDVALVDLNNMIGIWKPIAEFAAKTTEVLTPPGFKEALVYNLALPGGINHKE